MPDETTPEPADPFTPEKRPHRAYTEEEKKAWRKKRVNTNKKGNDAEKLAKAYLESQGYKVHRAVRAYRPIGNGRLINFQTDIFGCIDLVCKKPGERTRWIQVTTDSGFGRKVEALKSVHWDVTYDSVEIWQWMQRKMTAGMTRKEFLEWKHFKVRVLDDGFTQETKVHLPSTGASSKTAPVS